MSKSSKLRRRLAAVPAPVWAGIGVFLISVGCLRALGLLTLLVATSVLGLFIVYSQFWFSRQVRSAVHKEGLVQYRQLEALLALYAELGFPPPLPPMREWAGSPDFLRLIVDLIKERRPQLVVELGSGTSTIVIARILQDVPNARLVSIESEELFRGNVEGALSRDGLMTLVDLRLAPLADVRISNQTVRWYDLGSIEDLYGIDLLVVDGPPHAVATRARYPALPLLHDRLSEGAVILLDDASRPDEREVAQAWAEEFPDFDFRSEPLEKGVLIASRRSGG